MAEGIVARAEAIVHDLLEDLLPAGTDWQDLVRTYPLPALAVAGVGGYLLGRTNGPALVKVVSSFVAAELAKNIGSLLGQEIGT